TLPFLWNVLQTRRGRLGAPAGDDPWGGHTLEWATPSPPPPGNFRGPLPPIRSQRPVWDLRLPDLAAAPTGGGAGHAARLRGGGADDGAGGGSGGGGGGGGGDGDERGGGGGTGGTGGGGARGGGGTGDPGGRP
ncbi:MAG TPA: hypothetical protein VFZ77_03810, partial [Acidimicrobiales bacterium]